MDVGVVGLGQMGSGMARRLLEQGHRVTVWNRDPAKCAPFGAAGATIAATPAEAARAGTVITMLADDRAAEAVAFGHGGILEAGSRITHISSSTLSVALVNRLEAEHCAAGQTLVSMPVLGRPDVAAAGQLALILGGAATDLDRCRPLFESIGARTIPVGTRPAMAAAAKLALNASIALIAEMLGEAFAIAGGHGVSRSTMLDLFNETGFGNRIIASYGGLIVGQHYEPAGFPVRLGRKDVDLAIKAAGPDVALPVVRLLRDRLDTMIAQGEGDRDWASIGEEKRRA